MSLSGLSLSGHNIGSQTKAANLLPLHQVLIYGTYVLPRLYQFWEILHREIASKGPYQQASIRDLRFRLPELQVEDQAAREIWQQGLKKGWAEVEGVLYYEGLPYLPEIIRTEIISRHHDDPLARHFGIEKTQEPIARKYYRPTLQADIETYVKGYDVCMTSKAVRHKLFGDLQLLPVPTQLLERFIPRLCYRFTIIH